MLTKYFSLTFPCLLLLFACNKDGDLQVDRPSFDVTGYTIKDGIDSLGNPIKQIVFDMGGNADVISFYSGEAFREYTYKDGRIIGVDAVKASFDYVAAMGAGTNPDWKQLSIHTTTSFDGTVSESNDGWTDITNRFSLPMAKDFVGSQMSTSADITDLMVPGQPLYFAFKYITPAGRTTSGAYTTWDIHNFKVEVETLLGVQAVVSQSEAAIPLYHFGPNDTDDPSRTPRSVSTSSRLRFRANIVAAGKWQTDAAGDWGVAPPIIIEDEIDLGPDRPISIKSRIDPVLKEYAYVYNQPGTYKVAFVASNVTTKSEEKVIKELEIVVP